MTIKAIAFCRGHHAVKHLNPVTYSAGVDVAGSPSASQTEPPSGWRRAIQIQPLPNLNATTDREAWVLDEKNLGFVNFVGNRQYITLGNLAEIANAHTAISRGRRCHLSQLTLGKDVALPTSNYVAIALRVIFSQRRASAKIIDICHFRITKMLTTK